MPILHHYIDTRKAVVIKYAETIAFIMGLMCLGFIFTEVFFDISTHARDIIDRMTSNAVMVFIALEFIHMGFEKHLREIYTTRRFERLITLSLVVFLVFPATSLAPDLFMELGTTSYNIALLYLGFSSMMLTISMTTRFYQRSEFRISNFISGPRLFLVSFTIPILIGAILLKLPKSTIAPLSWLDSIFVATSALCVTGLSPVGIVETFSLTGQIVILGLFQIGALGLITITVYFVTLFSGQISIGQRDLALNNVPINHMDNVKDVIRKVITFTLVIETIGTALLCFSLFQENVAITLEMLFKCMFHAVSAFCNAGFSLYSQSLSTPSAEINTLYAATVMGLIVIGGLGFPVIAELKLQLEFLTKKRKLSALKLGTHVKLVLIAAASLITVGAVSIYFAQGDLTFFESLFLSITSRTAGFNLTDTSSLNLPTIMIVMLLMWIGAAPLSTGGGIKSTTFVVAIVHLWKELRQHKQLVVFERELDSETIHRAFAVIFFSILILFFSCFALIILNPHLPAFDLIFESVSAWGTVGLSRGATAVLSPASKGVVILLMFSGRVGILTLAMSLMPRRIPDKHRYLKDRIIIY